MALFLLACREPHVAPPALDAEAPCVEEVPDDGVDQDCDGGDAVDADLDGWEEPEDCDDRDASRHPGATEVCDGIDQDCDGVSDDGLAVTTWYLDEDGDGHGVATTIAESCAPIDGYAAAADDCDDDDGERHPGADEPCDGVDQDCDGAPEDDADGDGYRTCEDCDDAVGTTFPGAIDVCGDGVDDDCDGDAVLGCFDCDTVVPGDFASIQDAIDAAAEGEVVCVAPGTYFERVDFGGTDVTLWGVGGPEDTVLDPGLESPGVSFVSGESAAAVLRGFTITGAWASVQGGGIRIVGSSPTLESLVIEDNESWHYADGGGGGLYAEDGAPTLTNVVVRDNSGGFSQEGYQTGPGGGIYLVRADAILDNVDVDDNYAGEGGGIYLEDSDAVLTHVRVRGNRANLVGGGLYLLRSDARMTNVLVIDNLAMPYWGGTPDAGGISMVESAPALTNVVITGNFAQGDGGGVHADGSSPTLVNSIVAENDGASGNELYVVSGAPTLSWSVVYNASGDALSGMDDPGGTNLSVDPRFLDAACHLDAASPAIDVGDPTITDPDGSTSDLGIFGGSGAAGWDLDADGYPSWWRPGPYDGATSPGLDCDDDDATVTAGVGC